MPWWIPDWIPVCSAAHCWSRRGPTPVRTSFRRQFRRRLRSSTRSPFRRPRDIRAASVSSAELLDRDQLTDLQAEDLEDLLDELVGETGDLAGAEDAHAAIFARFGA